MNKYKEYGYTFEIIKGYSFNRANLFKEFIKELYKIKESTEKSDPMYLISKLLMNSLYGRFGMEIILNNSKIINSDKLGGLIAANKYLIEDIIDMGDKIISSI